MVPDLSWFTIKNFDDPVSGVQFDYAGWWGNKSLPELREDANGIVPGPKAHIFAATERWMNPKGKGTQHGIDGWRLDVAYVNQNLFGSHDTNRIGSYIVNRTLGNFRDWGKWFQMSQPINNPEFSVRKPNASELQLQKLFVVLQMNCVGAPPIGLQ